MKSSSRRRLIAAVAVAMALTGLAALREPAVADTAPATPSEPLTVAADSLPTPQINGVVWDQAVVGDTVFVVGEFTRARPAGSEPGVNEVPRANMLAYRLSTGLLVPGFAPTFDAAVTTVGAAADGSRVYVGGSFTMVNGANRYRLAALDPTSGALIAGFAPTPNASVKSLAVTPGAVYFGGSFTSVTGAARTKVAAAATSNGAVLPWRPAVSDGVVQAVTVSPDARRIVIGGSFTAVNGSSNPGYGLAMVDAAVGSPNLPMTVNAFVRDGGTNSAILSLKSDADGFYGSGYHYGNGGNLEGSFQADWNGTMKWVEDCHGDTYDVQPQGQVVYSASHKHYCGNLGTGGFPQTNPWQYKRATATTKYATGVSKKDPYGYPDHQGQPSPTMLNFYPDINTGTYTGKGQGPWTVESSADYVLFGGEFTRVNGMKQQGLTRFARKEIAPNKAGPVLAGASMNPALASAGSGAIKLTWTGNWDRDNGTLTYKVLRGSTTIDESSRTAPFWQLPTMTFTDTGLTPGTTVQYRIQARDPFGNTVTSDPVSTTVPGTPGGGVGVAADTFGRTVTGGWGSAPTGGPWTVSGGASSFSVDGDKGRLILPAVSTSRSALLGTVASTSTDLTADLALDKAATGGGTYVALVGRRIDGSNAYRAKLWLRANADVQLLVTKVVGGTESTVGSAFLTGVRQAAGDTFSVRFQVSGSGTTTLRARAWRKGAAEPTAWPVQATDTTAALQTGGSIGVWSYSSGSTSNTPLTISVDNLSATAVQ